MTSKPARAGGSPAAPVRTLPDRILGVLGAVMIAAAVFLLLFGGEPELADSGLVDAPILEIVATTANPDGPLTLTFRSSRPLRQIPGGWGTDGLHIHASLGGRELMPAPVDVQPRGDGTYVWAVRSVPAGDHEVYLFWAGSDHREIEAGRSGTVRIRVP